MKHSLQTFAIVLLAMVLLSGCIPSLNPITEKNETVLPELEGLWEMEQNRYQVELNGDFYAISVRTKDGKKDFYKMTLITIEGEHYASLTFDRDAPELQKVLSSTSDSFSLPVWRLYRLRVMDRELRLYWMNDRSDASLRDLPLFQKKGSTDSILNAAPDQLKAWLAKNKSAYAEGKNNFFTFQRSK